MGVMKPCYLLVLLSFSFLLLAVNGAPGQSIERAIFPLTSLQYRPSGIHFYSGADQPDQDKTLVSDVNQEPTLNALADTVSDEQDQLSQEENEEPEVEDSPQDDTGDLAVNDEDEPNDNPEIQSGMNINIYLFE